MTEALDGVGEQALLLMPNCEGGEPEQDLVVIVAAALPTKSSVHIVSPAVRCGPVTPGRYPARELTEVRTPQQIFFMPQRLLVPLFQRPYVWSQEAQWEPLWDDVQRLAAKRLAGDTLSTHFLGAVVLQQQANHVGALAIRTIIDGQQRLTTLQILLDAVQGQVAAAGFDRLATRLQNLIENGEEFVQEDEEQFKVWPTNRDRAAYREVMSAAAPVNHAGLVNHASRLTKAHEYFSESVAEWLGTNDDRENRADALVGACMGQLQIVAIELLHDEDAQEIFETLNARGTPLTPADLIKNLVFQRLNLGPEKTEQLYREYWSMFETPFWEQEVTSGRIKYSRSSLFLNHWLIARTFVDVPAREVFTQFKRYVADGEHPVADLLPRLKNSADRYRQLLDAASNRTALLTRTELFAYRVGTLDSEVVKPILVWLNEDEQSGIPAEQRDRCIAAIESWMVRRAIIRAKSSGMNRFMVDLLVQLGKSDKLRIGDATVDFLTKQIAPTSYWPGDKEVRRELLSTPIYRKLRRGRLRMILEALEDDARGFTPGNSKHEARLMRDVCSIEHVIPQNWLKNWGAGVGLTEHGERDQLVHLLGNLTLVTQSLNSSLSNAAWLGDNGKRHTLNSHTSLHLTRQVHDSAPNEWTDDHVLERTAALADRVLAIWPVPDGHEIALDGYSAEARTRSLVEVADLVRAGLIAAGDILWARSQAVRGRTATVGADGLIYLDGTAYGTLSGAARALTGSQSEAGWWFWLIDAEGSRCMSDVRAEYANRLDDPDEDDD
jgi:hypothetical protein